MSSKQFEHSALCELDTLQLRLPEHRLKRLRDLFAGIEWCDRQNNNFVRGCSPHDKECTYCYAGTQARRQDRPGGAYEGLTREAKTGGGRWSGKIRLCPEIMEKTTTQTAPQMIFGPSMGDPFHEDVPIEFIQRMLDLAASAPQHLYLWLTKRSERLREIGSTLRWPVNVVLGVSVGYPGSQFRLDDLRACGAKLLFASIEPLRERLINPDFTGIDWVIVGGESGPVEEVKKMEPEWVREVRDLCIAQGIAFFFKQWGTNSDQPGSRHRKGGEAVIDGRRWVQWPAAFHEHFVEQERREPKHAHPRLGIGCARVHGKIADWQPPTDSISTSE